MKLIDAVEKWAEENNLWCDKVEGPADFKYINLGKTKEGVDYMTLWENGRIGANWSNLQDMKLSQYFETTLRAADPDFFDKLKLIIDKCTE